MSPARRPAAPEPSPGRTPAQARIVEAATALFAEHGVGGTSLQMIAAAIGVTKAAVYHQFPTKDEIVIAVAEAELRPLADAVAEAEAEAERDPLAARRQLVERMVDLAVSRRRMEGTLLGDPVIVRFFAGHRPYRRVMDRLYRLLSDVDGQPGDRVPAAMLTAAIGGAAMHPLVRDLDDEALRTQLLRLAHRLLDIPA